MSGKKKNGNQDKFVKTIILITVILQLITSLVNLISKMLE